MVLVIADCPIGLGPNYCLYLLLSLPTTTSNYGHFAGRTAQKSIGLHGISCWLQVPGALCVGNLDGNPSSTGATLAICY